MVSRYMLSKSYNLTYGEDDIVLLIPNKSNAINNDIYFKGRAMPHIESIGFYSLPIEHDKSVLELNFSKTIVNAISNKRDDVFLSFLKHIGNNEPYMTSNKTVSMSEIKMKLLLK